MKRSKNFLGENISLFEINNSNHYRIVGTRKGEMLGFVSIEEEKAKLKVKLTFHNLHFSQTFEEEVRNAVSLLFTSPIVSWEIDIR